MSGLAVTAVRWRPSDPRVGRTFDAPHPADHPVIGRECPLCTTALTATQAWTALVVEAAAGADPDRWISAADAILVHTGCVGTLTSATAERVTTSLRACLT